MATQKYTGRNQLLKRLAAQVGSEAKAKHILMRRGQMTKGGDLTKEGQKRDNMTAEERAIDRASRKSGRSAAHYRYDPGTNRAILKGKPKRAFRRRRS